MANEAAVTLVLRMRDEASAEMDQFSDTTQQAQMQSLQMNVALTAMGSALTAVGSLLGQIDNQAAKTASIFLITAGAILTTTSAIIQSFPYILQLIAYLRTLAVTQAVVSALSGPVGWVGLGVAAGVGGAIAIGSMRGQGGAQTVVINNNIQGSIITEREVGEISRREIIKGQERNATSGIK